MAKCKDCGTTVGFLAGRCDSCKSKQAESKEKTNFEREVAGLAVEFDKMEDATYIRSITRRLGTFNFKRDYYVFGTIVENVYVISIVFSEEVGEWYWLSNNRTILLFPDNTKFVQDHGDLLSSDVLTKNDSVYCYELHRFDITEVASKIANLYHSLEIQNTRNADIHGMMLRIANDDNYVSLDMLRSIAAVYRKCEELTK